ncbi:MAG: hypothetical protein H6835_06530 [Planctomycetes bacterium]|nr:hypothetical protein [Planctomycetota bacterium]
MSDSPGAVRLIRCLAFVTALTVPGVAQQLGMFPSSGYFVHCRGPQTATHQGGDDDHVNIWFFLVDPTLADGTSAPDFYIHLFDGDHHAVNSTSGVLDIDIYSQSSSSVFEYRLYGGAGAATHDKLVTGQDPLVFAGSLIDIDSDANDSTLRTDDPDDNDDNSPEDLRDQGYSLIGVDIDANPGELVGGLMVFKFVVDGTAGVGGEWNRYRILGTRDAGRTDPTGVQMLVYELAYAGRPGSSATWSNLAFRVPATSDDRIDLQTLDEDRQYYAAKSRLWTPLGVYDDSATFETGEQYTGGQWRWSSVNQQASLAIGNGRTGFTYDSMGQTGQIWVFDVDPVGGDNPFSVRLMDSQGQFLPMLIDPVYSEYGGGGIGHHGAGLPRPGGSLTLFGDGAPANAPGLILFGPDVTNTHLVVPPFDFQLYVDPTTAGLNSIGFDANGNWTLSFPIPASVVPGYFYGQVFAFDFAPLQALHSNGLAIRVVP